jgi:hypothetical protein
MKKQMMTRFLDGAILVTLLAALTQTASATPVPDAGSTATLMGLACAGLVAIRRFRR